MFLSINENIDLLRHKVACLIDKNIDGKVVIWADEKTLIDTKTNSIYYINEVDGIYSIYYYKNDSTKLMLKRLESYNEGIEYLVSLKQKLDNIYN